MPTPHADGAAPDLRRSQGPVDGVLLTARSWGRIQRPPTPERVRSTADEVLQIDAGALYPALHRREHRGLIDADWDLTENKRRAKYYRLTTKGRQELRARSSAWDRYASAVSKVIHATVQPTVS